MKPDEMSNYDDLLPLGGLPVCGLRILSYINQNGQMCYQLSQVGDVAISQLLGIIEMAKFDITRIAVDAAHRKAEEDDF